MKFFYFLLLYIPTVYAMEIPEDDTRLDLEMQGEPGSAQSHTSSTPTPASSKSVSRMPTLQEGSSGSGSQTSSFPLLPYPYEGITTDASDTRIQQFEKDIESLVSFHVRVKTFPQSTGEFWKGLSHIQIKVLSDKMAALRHAIINDEHGLKGLYEFFQVQRPEFKRSGSAFFPSSTPEKQPKTFFKMLDEVLNEKITVENQKKSKSDNYKFCILATGVVVNTLAIAASFTVLYLK